MSDKVYSFMKALTLWPYSHIACAEWEFYNIGQNPSCSIFMKIPTYTSVVSVFIEVQNLFFYGKWLDEFISPQGSLDSKSQF